MLSCLQPRSGTAAAYVSMPYTTGLINRDLPRNLGGPLSESESGDWEQRSAAGDILYDPPVESKLLARHERNTMDTIWSSQGLEFRLFCHWSIILIIHDHRQKRSVGTRPPSMSSCSLQ